MKSYKSAFELIESNPFKIKVLTQKSDLVNEVCDLIKKLNLTQVKAAKLLGVNQSRISLLLTGCMSGFSMEWLLFAKMALEDYEPI